MRGIIYAIVLLMAISIKSFAQTTPNSFLIEVFSGSELAGFPDSRIQYLNYLSEEGWEITELPDGKSDLGETLPYLYERDYANKTITANMLSVDDIDGFNLLKYDYRIEQNRTMFRIYGCNKILVIKSHAEITAGFNEFRNQ